MPTKGPIITPHRAGMIRPAIDLLRKPGEGGVSGGGEPPEPEPQDYYFTPVILALMIND